MKSGSKEPEIAEFHASEKLFNPNESMPTIEDKIAPKSHITQDLMNSEFHQKVSKILDMISPHFTTLISFEKIFENFYGMPIDAILKDYPGTLKEKYFATIPNIKIVYFGRGIYISSNAKLAKNGTEQILSISEAMELLKGGDKKESNTSVADLKKKFYQR